MSYLIQALSLILGLAFNALALLFMLRILAEASRADFHNPLCQFIYRYSNPVIAPLRRIIPNWRRINTAALLLLWLLMLIKRGILFALSGMSPAWPGLLLLPVADVLDFSAGFYMVLIVLWSLLSLIATNSYHPAYYLMDRIVTPLLRPLRGRLAVGGLDFAPWAVLIALMLSRILIIAPLTDLGMKLAIGG